MRTLCTRPFTFCLAVGLIVAGLSNACLAQIGTPAPEIDPASGISALALLSGLLLAARGYRRK